jgi:hypothetical protein
MLSKDAGFMRRVAEVAASSGVKLVSFRSAQAFGRFVLDGRPGAGLIDVDSVTDSGAIPRMLRLASCHVPFIACMERSPKDDDRIYELGFNAIIEKTARDTHIEEVLGNFLSNGR